MASWYLSSSQGSVIQHLRPACSPHPHQALSSPPSVLHPLLMGPGGYKVSRRAARWAEGSTQLCMASTMLRMWSPRRRLPAESEGRRRGHCVRMATGQWTAQLPEPVGQPGSNPSSTSDSMYELGQTTWPPCAPVSLSVPCTDQHHPWQVILKMEIVSDPSPRGSGNRSTGRCLSYSYCSD